MGRAAESVRSITCERTSIKVERSRPAQEVLFEDNELRVRKASNRQAKESSRERVKERSLLVVSSTDKVKRNPPLPWRKGI